MNSKIKDVSKQSLLYVLKQFFKKLDYKYYIGIFVVAVLIVGGAIYIFRAPQSAEAEWFNESWMYRQQFDVYNNTVNDYEDYWVAVSTSTLQLASLESAGKLNSDFSDIRFTDASGNILKYMLSGPVETLDSIFIQMKSFPASATSSLYFYYNNYNAEEGQIKPTGTIDNPSLSCETIKTHYSNTPDGLYYIMINGGLEKNATQVYCNMTDAHGGWTLLFQRRGGTDYNNVETCGANLNEFLHDTCGSVSSLGYNDSYSLDVNNIFAQDQYFFMQYDGSLVFDSDDAFIIHGSVNLFPDSTGSVDGILVSSICDYTNSNCDTTDVYYWYTGDGWLGSDYCDANYSTGSYKGNYGYCQNGMSTHYLSNNLFGDRYSYNETKLWAHNNIADNYMERVFIKGPVQATQDIIVSLTGSEEKGPAPIAYWSFNEGYGTTAHDSTSNQNHGTLTNMTTTGSQSSWVDGKFGKGLSFDGVDDYVRVTDADSLDVGTNDLTISVWLKTDINDSQQRGIVDKLGGGPSSWTTQMQYGKMQFGWWTDSFQGWKSSNSIIADNQWHHIVVIVDRSSENIYFYKDGVADGIHNFSGISSADFSGTAPIDIGHYDGSAVYFDGTIDEVRIYDYALSVNKIKKLYNTKAKDFAGINLSSSKQDAQNQRNRGLVGFWKMDEASWSGVADEVIDSSGNGNHCVSVSGVTTTSTGKYFRGADMAGSATNQGANCDYILNGAIEFSMSAWIKTSQLEGSSTGYTNPAILGSSHGSGFVTNDFSLLNKNGYLSWWDEFQGAYQGAYETDAYISDDEWHHVAMSRVNEIEGDNSTMIYLYMDGIQVGAFETGEGIIEKYIRLGYSYSNTDIDGVLDHVKIWNRALSTQEISEEYVTGPAPVAYWSMDSIEGTTVIDQSGNGNDGIMTNMTKSDNWKPGRVGQALEFMRDNSSYIDLGTDASLEIGQGDWTLEFWFYPYDTADHPDPGLCNIIERAGYSGNKGYMIRWQNSTFRTLIGDGNSGIYWISEVSDVLPPRNWYHYVLVLDRDGVSTIYINGEISDTETDSNFVDISQSDNTFISSAGNAHGLIDEVKIYNYALTPYQIAQEYNGGAPLAYWSFDEGQGAIAHDQSGHDNHGTLTNITTTGSQSSWVNGKFGKGLRFDGVDDYINAGNFLDNGETTLTLWFNSSYQETHNFLIDFAGSTSRGHFDFNHSGDGRPILYLSNNNFRYFSSSAADYMDGKWHFLVLYIPGSEPTDILNSTLTIDNINIESSSTISSEAQNTWDDLYIGGGGGVFFNGTIDEVKIYNYRLTSVDIQQEYNSRTKSKTSLNLSQSEQDQTNARADGLVGWWKMDESSWSGVANEVIDSSGNGNHGTAYDGASTTSTAKYAMAGEFDGVDDKINVGMTGLDYDQITVSFWSRFDNIAGASGNSGIIFGSRYWTDNNFSITQHSGDYKLMFTVGVSDYAIYYNIFSETDKWYHFIFSYDSTKENWSDALQLYVDGVKRDFYSSAGNTETIKTTTDIYISGTNLFDGLLDEVKIWNRALSSAEIEQEYHNALAPVAYWSMDQIEGTTVIDQSGQGNNGTLANMTKAEAWKPGKVGQSLKFDGENDSINLGIPDVLQMGNGVITVSHWIKPDCAHQTESAQLFYGNAGGSHSGYGTRILSDCRFGYEIYGSTGGRQGYNQDIGIVDGEWNHIIAIFDGVNNQMTAYLNGVQKHQVSISDPGTVTATINFRIGAYHVNGWFYNGQIDEVKVYNYALTPYQIAQEYNGGAPIAYYSFDEKEGTIAHNETDNVHHGTLINMDPATDWFSGSDCIKGGCLDFDGSDDYVNLGSDVPNDLTGDITISAWIKPISGGDSNSYSIIDNNKFLLVSYLTNNNILFSSDGSTYKYSENNSILLDTWQHILITRKADGTTNFYINGKLNGEINQNSGTPQAGTVNTFIGNNEALNRTFNGKLDEIKIWNYILTEEDIKEDYNLDKSIYFK